MKTMKEILHTADGITKQPMLDTDLEYRGDEVHELLDLVQADGQIHDLDKYEPEHMQSTLGATLCWVMKRLQEAERELLAVQQREIDRQREEVARLERHRVEAERARLAEDSETWFDEYHRILVSDREQIATAWGVKLTNKPAEWTEGFMAFESWPVDGCIYDATDSNPRTLEKAKRWVQGWTAAHMREMQL